jgi:hypothetical protein
VFGGTFYGEMFFLGFIYYWITNQFKMWHLFFVILFIFPHVLAMGRLAWAALAFSVLLILVMNFLNKKDFRLMFKQVTILVLLSVTAIFTFIQFIPESDFYIRALNSRLFQGQEDVKYSEGTYGTKSITQNSALVSLWKKSDIFFGIGMHPMWVVGPDTREEYIYYSAFSDVGWAAVLAAYGIVGFSISLLFQIYYLINSFRIIKSTKKPGLYLFFITLFLSKLIFDVTVCFSYVFLSTGLGVLFGNLYIYVPILVYVYEHNKHIFSEYNPYKLI